MHGYLYILQSAKDKSFYIGSAEDLDRRFFQHNNGLVRSTKGKRPLELKFYKKYDNIADARRAEYKLKSFKSRKILQLIVNDQNLQLEI